MPCPPKWAARAPHVVYQGSSVHVWPVQATNADFANKLYMTPEVASSARFAKPKLDQTGFTIQHYAGAVTYKTENFLAKNKDFVVAEHQQLMQNSSQAFVRGLFPPDAEDQQPEKVTPCSTSCFPRHLP